MPKKQVDKMEAFYAHRFDANGTSGGDQQYGDCPFCGKENKLYVNTENYLWDCKSCGLRGNFEAYLENISEVYHAEFINDEKAQEELVKHRKLPLHVFKDCEDFGYDGYVYTLLVRDAKGKAVDIRRFNMKTNLRARSTKACNSGLFGQEQIAKHKDSQIFFCEGEWDGFAARLLVKRMKLNAVVVATGGANIFKKDWVESFKKRDIIFFYDNDQAGEDGELRAFKLLHGIARNMLFVHWLDSLPKGFDLRDWITHGVNENKNTRKCWVELRSLLHPVPRNQEDAKEVLGKDYDENDDGEELEHGSITSKDVFEVYRKWLHMQEDTALAVMFGVLLANRLEGDPLWMFLIAPPGGMKSELLMSLDKARKTHLCSSLTPHALVSGANFGGGGDPSMMPKLDGKVLVLKDFTTTLTMHPTARDEIFGQLRDAYDGKFEKFFGNGIVRNYEAKFGVLAGCTPNIDAFASLHAGLGERFLKYRFDGVLQEEDESSRIRRALSNVNRENNMRSELQEIAKQYLKQRMPDKLPVIPDKILDRLVALAMLTSRLRGVVNRDQYNPSMIHSKASHEIGTRLSKQLAKLLYGIAMYYQLDTVDERCYRIAAKVAVDSLSDKIEELVRSIYMLATNDGHGDGLFTTQEIVEATPKLTRSTIQRALDDLKMLNIIREAGTKGKKLWGIAPRVLTLIKDAHAWQS